jgi:hypothetical protein
MAKTFTGYGQNQSAVPSSLTPDQDVGRSPYAPNLSDAHERVCANGVASNPQLRKIDARPEVAPGYGHRNRGADAAVKVPAKTVRR